jgi:hypothetical protein
MFAREREKSAKSDYLKQKNEAPGYGVFNWNDCKMLQKGT